MSLQHAYYILKLLRPRQWIKNVAIFAAITFGGLLFDYEALSQVTIGFIAFCFLASSTYIVNDLLDVKKDRLHPFKKSRPIASGKVSTFEAIVIFVIVFSTAIFFSYVAGGLFIPIAVFYIVLQILYSLLFKGIVVFDIFFIATGYILRVLAGEVLSGLHISVWLLLTTVSLSLFLAVGKRRSELTLLKNFTGGKIQAIRESLSHYSEPLLDAYIAIFATTTVVFYSLFTYLENPRGIHIDFDLLMPEFLPYYLQRKWLMLTIPLVLYGLMRYLQDIYEKKEGESPDRVLLSDKQLLTSVVLWTVITIVVIYFLT